LNKSQFSADQGGVSAHDSFTKNITGRGLAYPEPTSTTLDPNALRQLLKLVGEVESNYFELIDLFLEEAPKLLHSIRKAAENKDKELLYRTSHTLKSSSRDFGAIQLAKISEKLESISKTNGMEGVLELVEQVETKYKPVENALRMIRAGVHNV